MAVKHRPPNPRCRREFRDADTKCLDHNPAVKTRRFDAGKECVEIDLSSPGDTPVVFRNVQDPNVTRKRLDR